MASSSSSGVPPADGFDANRAEVLAYRRGPNDPAGGRRSANAAARSNTPYAAPPVVLRMPDLNDVELAKTWEPVIHPIRYKLILTALAMTALLLGLCYWILKADLAPRPEEAPPWERSHSTPGPVKVERPTEGRLSTHQPVPTWTVTRLPAVEPAPNQNQPAAYPTAPPGQPMPARPPIAANPPYGAGEQAGNVQPGPRLDLPANAPADAMRYQTPPNDESEVAHRQNRFDAPQTTPPR